MELLGIEKVQNQMSIDFIYEANRNTNMGSSDEGFRVSWDLEKNSAEKITKKNKEKIDYCY